MTLTLSLDLSLFHSLFLSISLPQTVLVHLLLCLVIFYSLYYMIGSVCFGAFRCDTFLFLSACTCGYWVSDLAGTVSRPHAASRNLVPGDRREGEGFVESTATIGLFSLIGMTVSFNHPGSLLAPPFEYPVCLFVLSAVLLFAFRLDHFDGLIPFDFKTEPTNLESNSKYLGERRCVL